MNWNLLRNNWRQFQCKVQENWDKLTIDDLDLIAGERQLLLGSLQKRYGLPEEETEREVSSWERG